MMLQVPLKSVYLFFWYPEFYSTEMLFQLKEGIKESNCGTLVFIQWLLVNQKTKKSLSYVE